MPQTEWGPVNIQYGNSAFFTAEFYDINHDLTVPSGATLAVSYTNINFLPQTDSFAMTLLNSFFNATWSSTNASLGLASWSIVAAGNSSASQIGQIRVIDP
jgi:hypothetical protein